MGPHGERPEISESDQTMYLSSLCIWKTVEMANLCVLTGRVICHKLGRSDISGGLHFDCVSVGTGEVNMCLSIKLHRQNEK